MSKNISDRSRVIRTAGISLGAPESTKRVVESLHMQYKNRDTPTPNMGILCPRCNKATKIAKLSNDDIIDYCRICRYVIPRPNQGA